MKHTLFFKCLLASWAGLFAGGLLQAQTNSFPLYSSGAYSGGGVGDNTSSVTNAQLKLQATTGYIRVINVSADAVNSIVYNYQTGKSVFWGESVDAGYYYFRGRHVIVLDGVLGVGVTDTKGYKLAVNGSAVFNSATVKLTANWPDYVFQKEYVLPSLASVEDYIRLHHHLQGMPAADSVAKTGLDLGQNQTQLLKKIEELTLYLIDQDKKIKLQEEQGETVLEQEEKVEAQEREIGTLKEALERQEKEIEELKRILREKKDQ